MMVQIPSQIKDFSFVICDIEKRPIHKGWQKKIIKWDNEELQSHISNGGNYGVSCGDKSLVVIDGNTYYLLVIDFDNKHFQDLVAHQIPETFMTTSGSDKKCNHYWIACDSDKSFKIVDEKLQTLADIQGTGKQVISVGSKHKSGSVYSVVNDVPIAFMSYAELQALLVPYDKRPKKIKKQKEYRPKNIDNDVVNDIINSVSFNDVLQEVGIDTSKNPTNCFAHDSVGGKCLGYDDETAHCFHCDGAWNRFSLIRDAKNLGDKETFDWFAEKSGRTDELQQARDNYKEEERAENIRIMTDKITQAEYFAEAQPYFYDKAKNWWLWDKYEYRWEVVDEVDVLNMINASCNVGIIASKDRTETLNALKQEGRHRIPKPIGKTWIQFKDRVIDVMTGEEIEATPDYFVTNPIPWSLGEYPDTPNMDRIFKEWVGEESVELLYEILAYCLIPDMPLHRIFCFLGSGMNGKSKFLQLLDKFIGSRNTSTTELDRLLMSRFEVTRLYKKLVCQMGETNFSEMDKTSLLKQLSGGDRISFEYKGKDNFDDYSYAKIIIATNNLPATSDKTTGFFRRWVLIDFPNTFTEKKDILSDIPEDEYNNLALRSIITLRKVLEKREFTNEGTVEERQERYESKSNFLETFVKTFVKESYDGYITVSDFNRKFREWCKENRHREMSETSVGRNLKKLNWNQTHMSFDWMHDGKGGRARVWTGVAWK